MHDTYLYIIRLLLSIYYVQDGLGSRKIQNKVLDSRLPSIGVRVFNKIDGQRTK